ncbi:acyl-CoA thioesterase [Nocardioides sp. zg-DK7169]|uniref:acyl-CoA thioesterase n=1 Tax=Nocardioides sp. zg-DK7169 TaxID=2736600 RepID=UPI0034648701
MRHLYECPMRWADLDLLGHVNNVTYVDYLQEARVDMLRTHDLRSTEGLVEGIVVARHEVTYLAPLMFGFRPVSIECWVTDIRAASFTMAYEVFHPRDDGGRTVYLRATTVLSPYVFAEERPRRLTAEEKAVLERFREDAPPASPQILPVPHTEGGHYPVRVRFSDVDVYGHVNNVKYFEYLQEARIWLVDQMVRDAGVDTAGVSVVVAQTDVDYKVPILFRPEAYDVWSTIAHLGTKSMVIESEICDGEQVLARARVVMVFFDVATQRSAAPPEEYREVVEKYAARTRVASV